MELAFIMGVILGFILGMGYCLFFTDMLALRLLRTMGKKSKKDDDDEDDEPANYWKPKGWKPDEP